MKIRTFEQLVLLDPDCAAYTLVRLTGEYDEKGKELIAYKSYSPSEWVGTNTPLEIQGLRDRVVDFLKNKPWIIIIDDNNQTVFTNILDNPWFLFYAKNTEYRFQLIDEDMTVAKIVRNAFPVLEESLKPLGRERCVVM